jgi:hypothetical protein
MSDRASHHRIAFLFAAGLAASGLAREVRAEPVYFTTHLNQFLRWTGDGSVSTFQVSANLTSLDFDADGRLWATGASDPDGNGLFELFTVDGYLTDSPQLVSQGEFLDGRVNSIAFIGGVLYGLSNSGGSADTIVKILHPDSQTEETLGTLPVGALSAMGYDLAGDVLHTIALAGDDEGYNLLDYQTPDWSFIGNVGAIDWTNTGGAFFEGAYYVLNTPSDGSSTHLYRVNPDSSVALVRDLSDEYGPNRRGGHALAIIPEPATGLLILLGGLLILRRRESEHRAQTR